MHETDSRNTRLARLAELERRHDGPIPEAALRALGFPSETFEKMSDARREMAVFRRLLLESRAAKGRRCPGDGRRAAATQGSDRAIYLACWRERRRRLANLLAERAGGR